jgi:hypothetical protein
MPEVFSFYDSSAVLDIQAAADDREVTKMLYSRRDAAFALSISIRSLDYLISNKKLSTRKLGKKIMIPQGELSRFARADHSALTQHPEDIAVH